MNLKAPIDFIPLHIRGGYIIPTQDHARTTEKSRKNPFGIIVAPNGDGEAQGDLFYDNGSSDLDKNLFFYATFSLRETQLKMNIEQNTYLDMGSKKLNKIRIFVKKPTNKLKFIVNQKIILTDNQIELRDNEIILKNLNLPMTEPFEIEWTSDSSKTIDDSQLTLIDCSVQNDKITEDQCKQKKCLFNPNSVEAPKCTIPASLGGYKLSANAVAQKGSKNIVLEKADDFNLFKNDIKNVNVQVSHGAIRNSAGKNRLTRIKISDASGSRYEVPVKLNFDTDENENLNVKVDSSSQNSKAYFEISNKAGKTL